VCAASQVSIWVAICSRPVSALNKAKKAVSAVQAVVRLPGQSVPGRMPPLGSRNDRSVSVIALTTAGSAAAKGGPRKVTAASSPESAYGRRW
jgi:hypothetical protein